MNDSVVKVEETGPREERKKKRPGKRSKAEHITPVNIGYVSEDSTPWQVQQPTQPRSPSPKKPSPGRPATTLRRPSYEWSRTLSASRPPTEEELAAQERSEREATEQRNRLLASLWNQNKGQSSKEPSQKRPSSPKQSGPRPFDPQEVAKDGRGKVVYATSLNDPRARGLAQGIPQNTSVTATAKWFASIKGLDDSVVDDTHDTDEDKKKPLKLFQPKKSMYRDDRPPSPHPQAKGLREKNKAYMDRIMDNSLVEKALRHLGRSGSEPKQEDIDDYVFRKKSLDRSSRQHSFDSSDDESDKDLAILSGNESDPSARSPRSPDRRRPRSPEKNRSPKQARPRSPETKPPERDQSRSPQRLNPANEKRDRARLNLDWRWMRSQSGVRDQKRQSEGANQQPSEQKPPSSGPTGGRQKPFHPSELGLGGRTFYYESADQVPPAWKDRSGSASG
nr:PREDICTED: serine/arginine-rich splicing factor SR45-like [Bemisia tabaci]